MKLFCYNIRVSDVLILFFFFFFRKTSVATILLCLLFLTESLLVSHYFLILLLYSMINLEKCFFPEPFFHWFKKPLIIFRGVTFHSLLVTCWNSLVARYLLKNNLLLVAKVPHYKETLVSRFKTRSLLVAEVARCKLCLLLVAEITRYKKYLVTCCKICSLQKFFVAKNYSFWTKPLSLCLIKANNDRQILFICSFFQLTKNRERFLIQNKDTFEISVIHILPMYPLSLTLSTHLPLMQKRVR